MEIDEWDCASFPEGTEGRNQGAEAVPRPPVQFVEPPRSRKECAVRCELLGARVSELQEQGLDGDVVQTVQRSLEQEERWAKVAGGLTPARLKMEIMSQGRRNHRKREAIQKSERQLEGMRKAVEDAAAALQKAESSIEDMRQQLRSGEQRYAHLTSQQAAESRPADEQRDVREALDKLHLLNNVVPEEAKAPLEVLRRAVGRFYPAGAEASLLLSEAGLAPHSDVEISDADEEYVDDEDGVTEALAALLESKTLLRDRRASREKELVESISTGSPPVADILKRHQGLVKEAEQQHTRARSGLEEARERARRDLAERRARQEQQRSEAREAELRDAAAAARIQMRSGSTQRERTRAADGGDDEVVPCPPPAKWRRAEDDGAGDGDESDCTIDETPVLELAGAAIAAGAAMRTLAATPVDRHDAAAQPPTPVLPPQRCQQRSEQRQELAAATSTPELDIAMADAAVGLVRSAARSATRESERRRSQRRSSSCHQADRDDGRSKSPRRPSAAQTQEEQTGHQ